MGALDRIFGLLLILAGVAIAVYYSAWEILSLVYSSLLPKLIYIAMCWKSLESTEYSLSLPQVLPSTSLALYFACYYPHCRTYCHRPIHYPHKQESGKSQGRGCSESCRIEKSPVICSYIGQFNWIVKT